MKSIGNPGFAWGEHRVWIISFQGNINSEKKSAINSDKQGVPEKCTF